MLLHTLVEDVKDLLDHLLSYGREAATHCAQKLLITNATGPVPVEMLMQQRHVLGAEAEVVQPAALFKLISVQ